MRRALVALVVLALAGIAVGAQASPPHDVDKWAVVIGIDHFQGRTHPNVGAVGDADDFTFMLEHQGWPSDHILELTDGAATAANIRSAFKWLHDHSGPHTYSVFHYSGHVKQLAGDRDRDGEDVDEYLWPHDNQFIADGEFAGWMRSMGGWLWVDIAGCEAAGFNDGIAAPNRLFTASSQENEKSYEYPQWKNSVFTGLLADQGTNQHKADYNHDGRVSVTEAFRMAAEQAPQITAKQSKGPQHPYTAGGDGSEWFMDAPPPPPPPPPPPQDKPRQCTVAGLICQGL